jgi:CRISPR-associated protein Cpf1
LLYYTLINQKGEIIKQDTLNVIANTKQKVDYHSLLDKKENERATARVAWGIIENIKELKEGYLSQVIHKLTDLMIANNAIIAMEDLNFGFKRGRQKVEKQVYQKFEKMLIDKLNYLVDKNKKANEPGGLLNAFQLANKFESFQKMGKQSGFIFYVPAWNTSKIDPVTGFVDLLKPKYENLTQAKEFFEKFDSICFNGTNNYFEFSLDYKKFTEKADGGRTKWTVCTTNEDRYSWNKTLNNNKGGQENCNVTERLKALFDGKIEYKNGKDLQSEIARQEATDFFKMLMKNLSITLSLRHNNGEKNDSEQDYILTPVADNKGQFFDSRKAETSMPQNADANGAYHIALKGLWCMQQINEASDLKKINLAISNKEWLRFVQERTFQK